MNNKQKIFEFLKTQQLTVISTLNEDNTPRGTIVGFAAAEDLSLIFGTETVTQKYKNIQKNPHVAFTFGGENRVTVQYQGKVVPFKELELEKYKQLYLTKTPEAKKYDVREKNIFLKVIPTWIRYIDYNQKPPEIIEITEF